MAAKKFIAKAIKHLGALRAKAKRKGLLKDDDSPRRVTRAPNAKSISRARSSA